MEHVWTNRKGGWRSSGDNIMDVSARYPIGKKSFQVGRGYV